MNKIASNHFCFQFFATFAKIFESIFASILKLSHNSVFFPAIFFQMIPTGDESCETRLTTDEQFNINRSNSTATWTYSYAADCADDNGNQVDEKFQSVTSRTDKPRLAHEVYWHWMTSVGPFGNHNIMCNKAPTFPLNKNDLLIAAYSGSSLMFRKWNNCDFGGKEQSSGAATFGGIKNGLMAHHFFSCMKTYFNWNA